MPTTKPRHAITETDEVASALEAAARRWPEDRDRRAVLLRRLIIEGSRSLNAERSGSASDRLAAIEETAGALTGAYGDGYLEGLRADWPE